MAFRLTDDEAWDFVARAHTGILTTLRRDGRPVTVPVWHVVHELAVFVRTPAATKNVVRIRHDPRPRSRFMPSACAADHHPMRFPAPVLAVLGAALAFAGCGPSDDPERLRPEVLDAPGRAQQAIDQLNARPTPDLP